MKKKSRNGNIVQLVESAQQFVSLETLGGIVLLLFSALALVLSNSALAGRFHDLWDTEIGFVIGTFQVSHSLHAWINEGLMAVFFFVIGLEIKRELLFGELSSREKRLVPVVAAAGGALVPAFLYLLFNYNTEGARGWGIPMATDIAFVLGIIALLGKKVPRSLKVFVLAFAIIDDLIAILVIAFFYTPELNIHSLLLGLGVIAAALVLKSLRLYHPVFFLVLGIVSWFALFDSGVHPTIAGVAMAFTIPAIRKTKPREFADKVMPLMTAYQDIPGNTDRQKERQQEIISRIKYYSSTTQSPMYRLIHLLHPVSSFLIMPVFALANAGIHVDAGFFSALQHPVSAGIIAGLFIGKPVGIFLSMLACVKLKIGSLPTGTNWKQIFAMAALGGMGFTLSLFVSVLAFEHTPFLAAAKYGVLTGSLISVIMGCLLFIFSRNPPAPGEKAVAG